MEEQFVSQLADFNRLLKEMDEIYSNYARQHGLSESAFWILYSIQTGDRPYTQRELCAAWSYSPQTINSALKIMEKQGVIQLVPCSGRNKQIRLTTSGQALAEQVVWPLIQAERCAFAGLGEAGHQLLALLRRYNALLQQQTAAISPDCAITT